LTLGKRRGGSKSKKERIVTFRLCDFWLGQGIEKRNGDFERTKRFQVAEDSYLQNYSKNPFLLELKEL
jgi:hypothetical protein